VTRDDRQRRIQEFLDGRLETAERQAFEDELRDDPKLAQRVAFLREVGEALRAEPDPLPPGFYTRLGARFGSIPETRRWFRPVSWETAGLIAAVALAAVLFLPSLVRREIADLPGAMAPAGDRRAVETAEPAEAQPSRRPEPAKEERFAESPGVAEQETLVDELDEQETVPVEPTASKLKKAAKGAPETDRESFAPVPPSAPSADSGRVEGSTRESAAKDDADAAAPQPEPLRQDRAAAPSEAEPQALGDRFQPVGSARSEEARTVQDAALAGAPLEPGTVGPGIVRLVEPIDDERKRMAQSLAAPLRSILVGPRETALDCGGARLRVTADGYEILLARGESRHGCRFDLPGDGRPVRVVDPP